jgi:hypothetical protein
MSETKRSKGVTLLGWLFIFSSVMAIVSVITLKSRLVSYGAAHFELPSSYYFVVQSFTILNMIACFVAGIGLLKTLGWARILTLLITLLSFLYNIGFYIIYTHRYTIPYFVSSGKPVFILYLKLILGLIWTAFIFHYFNRANVKVQFQRVA